MARKKTFQQALGRLEEIASGIESVEVPLEESLKLYKEAVGLFAFCNQTLDNIESEVAVLRKTAAGEFVEETFEAQTP